MNYRWRVDVLYIDASHTSIDVFIDMTQWWPLISCNGVMYGDDYNIPSVKIAVDSWIITNNISNAEYTEQVWIIVKRCVSSSEIDVNAN